jgi:hypothetical protein
MDFSCSNCQTVTSVQVNANISYIACPKCNSYFKKRGTNEYVCEHHFKSSYYDNQFTIGQTAIFEGEKYCITGILIKNQDSTVKWIEYVLQNGQGNWMYLSECDGHFILMNEIDFEKKVGNHPAVLDYENLFFDLYSYSVPDVEYAAGFFDFDILNKIELIEYIHPPYILSFERSSLEQTCFYGKHISRRNIKKAFNISQLPAKNGIGMIQPFFINFNNLLICLGCIAILILSTHWFLTKDRVEKEVLQVDLPFEKYKQYNYISPSFVLEGSSAPLSILVDSQVDNSWANVQVALINERTNEEIYASKDVEYYHGYTDGENWTEGGNFEEFNICGLAAGQYHLTFSPLKAPEDLSNRSINVRVIWNQPSLRNVYMVFIFMIIFGVGIYYISKYFEESRWKE